MKPSLRLIHARYITLITCPTIHVLNSVPFLKVKIYMQNLIFIFVVFLDCRLHAQALTLAVLSGAAAYRYYENRAD